MDWKLEVVIVPVSDVERALEFYQDKLGFRLDNDFHPNEQFRAIQLTPPGSGCSIVFGIGLGGGVEPGSLKGTHLVVNDIEAAHALLEAAGVENSGPVHFVAGAQTPGVDPNHADYGTFVYFDDPDHNTWALQEVQPLGPMTDLEPAFAEHRRALHVHCYRMLASYDDAEDAVQETYLRAWRSRDTFEGEHARAWLYKIATNVCLDKVRAPVAGGQSPPAEVSWLTAYPDDALEPDATYAARETIELAFLVALQALPGRQRAALLGREVLGLTAAETAELIGTTEPAANSALQRARETMRQRLPRRRTDWATPTRDAEEQRLLAAFIDASERNDAAAALAIAAYDIRITMPPYPTVYDGHDALAPLLERAFSGRDGNWRYLPTAANRMPAVISYLRRPGDTAYSAFKVDVLRIERGRIAEITAVGAELFVAAGLPEGL